MIKSWTDEAWEDFEYWTKQDKKTFEENITVTERYRQKWV